MIIKSSFATITLWGIMLMNILPLFGQMERYSHKNDSLWHKIYLSDVSEDKNWIEYKQNYENRQDTLFIKNLETSENIGIADGYWGSFSENSKWFTAKTGGDTLVLIDLNTGSRKRVKGVKWHDFSNSGNFLIIHTSTDRIKIIDLQSNVSHSTGTVSGYSVNPKKDFIASVTLKDREKNLYINDLKTHQRHKVMGGEGLVFKNLTWNAQGEKLAFLYRAKNEANYGLGYYDLLNKTIEHLTPSSFSKENNGWLITGDKLSISSTGDKVFFYAKPAGQDTVANPDVEIWKTMDKWIFPRRERINPRKKGPWLQVWFPRKNHTRPLGTKQLPNVIFNPDFDYALNFDKLSHGPQLQYYPVVDLYAMKTSSSNSKRKLIIKNQYIAVGHIYISPQGKYITYFKNHHWWNYELATNKKSNLTENLAEPMWDAKSFSFKNPKPYGFVGWTKEGKVILYDEYDIWKMSSNGKVKEKLTNGRKTNTVYRVAKIQKNRAPGLSNEIYQASSIDLKDGLLVKAKNRDNLKTGFYLLNDSGKQVEIVFKDKRVDNLYRLDANTFLFKEESFIAPQEITIKDIRENTSQTIVQSNPQWCQYQWPRVDLFDFKTEIADNLKAIMIYPVDYDPQKKYPMLVHVYQEQSSTYHRFTPPSLFNSEGFNAMNYALDGYFVLFPDIQYDKEKPGKSAVICVEEAVDEALGLASIDKTKIGLIGHSYGGYETAFIVTHTDLFAAAVSGAGIFNLVGLYFDIHKAAARPELQRVEDGQFRMKESYFANPKKYHENSPICHMENIKTPMLIWSGKEDANINPNQSMQGYLALRRLEKPGVLYLYKNENHTLSSDRNKKDLTNRIKTWFNNYLK